MYKSDEDIAEEYRGFKVTSIQVKESLQSGYIDIEFPEGEYTAGGCSEICDHWMLFEDKITLDSWYPDFVYLSLCEQIKKAVQRRKEGQPCL